MSEKTIKWATAAVRSLLESVKRPKDGIPCKICGKHDKITEAHHLVSVAELTELINEWDIPLDKLKTTIIWLCPNCHTYFHRLKGLFDTDTVVAMTQSGYTYDQILSVYKLHERKKEEYDNLTDESPWVKDDDEEDES